MLKSDAIDLFDLSEAGRLLYRDPVRLAREARMRHIPATWAGDVLALPIAWVEAEAGISAVDAETLRTYWLERLAPASPDARRAQRDRDQLPVTQLLTAAGAAARLHADPVALRRLDMDGTLPSIRVDGSPHYDEILTDLLADPDAATGAAILTRTAEVRRLAQFEYTTGSAPAPRPPSRPSTPPPPTVADTAGTADPDDARAFEIPAHLDLDAIEPIAPPPSRLIEADGFDVIDED